MTQVGRHALDSANNLYYKYFIKKKELKKKKKKEFEFEEIRV